MQNKPRPKYLNLFMLAPKMSITAKISILHRISGVLLFLAIPLLLYLLRQSLISQDSYSMLYHFSENPIIKLIYILFIWFFFYHLCSGIRFLLLDNNIGVEKVKAKISSYIVLAISLLLTIILGVAIW